MLVLFETPAGFALFKVLDEGKLDKVEVTTSFTQNLLIYPLSCYDLRLVFIWFALPFSPICHFRICGRSLLHQSRLDRSLQMLPSLFLRNNIHQSRWILLFKFSVCDHNAFTLLFFYQIVKLKAFNKFENTSDALSAATLLIDSKPSKGLRKFLRAHCDGETLAVADSKLGNAIKEKLVSYLCCITCLVDTMIIQAIGLLDDLDKELNTYAMRVREWYGWHFPELSKIVQDNIQYAKVVKLMGNRTNAVNLDFSEVNR
ncbi:hypothetical protein BHM03_00012266 [Ensete ventricosum]|nr:hypothetical protein BHM03_00012266 [Ensete ventricosum]